MTKRIFWATKAIEFVDDNPLDEDKTIVNRNDKGEVTSIRWLHSQETKRKMKEIVGRVRIYDNIEKD